MKRRWKGIRTLDDPTGWQNNPSLSRKLKKDMLSQLNLLWGSVIDRPEWLQRNELTLPEVAGRLLQPSWRLHSGGNYWTIEGDSSTNGCWQPHPLGRCSNSANIRLRNFFFPVCLKEKHWCTNQHRGVLFMAVHEWASPTKLTRNGSWLVLVVFWGFCASPQVWTAVRFAPGDHPSHKVQDPPRWGGGDLNINWLVG